MTSVYTSGSIDYDNEDHLQMQLWIRKHPAMLKAEADLDCAMVAKHVVHDLLGEEWALGRMPHEGKMKAEAEAEEERLRLAAAEADLLVETLRDDLKAAIAKYGIKVPSRAVAATAAPVAPKAEEPAPSFGADALKALVQDAPKDEKGDIDWGAVVGEVLRAVKG